MKATISKYWIPIVVVLSGSLFLSALVPLLFPAQDYLTSAWKVFQITLPGLTAIYIAWKITGAETKLIWLLGFTLALRLGVGLFAELALPLWGYDEPVQKSGYLFYDAYKRDNDAWALAKSGEPIWLAFKNEFVSDQYGGLLSLSAWVYRDISSDQHQPELIVLLTTICGTMSVPFVFGGVTRRWKRRVAWTAAIITALFPDAILFGASQMREPLLIFLSALTFWASMEWANSRLRSSIAMLLGIIGLLLVSYRVAIPVIAVLAGWFLLDRLPQSGGRKLHLLVWGAILLAGIAMAFLSWEWLKTSSSWDIKETVDTSGRVQYVFESIPEQYKIPFVVLYGLTQPVLPAAIVDPSLPIWRTIAIFRGIGWYAIAPLLLYGIVAIFKEKDPSTRRSLLWLVLCIAIWVLVSSVRAGGDQWDNPRYRSIFLVYLSVVCGWAWEYGRRMKDAWLGRIYLIEAVFVGFFLEWYISRYYQVIGRLRFEVMLICIAVVSGAIIVTGLVWDRIKAKQIPAKP